MRSPGVGHWRPAFHCVSASRSSRGSRLPLSLSLALPRARLVRWVHVHTHAMEHVALADPVRVLLQLTEQETDHVPKRHRLQTVQQGLVEPWMRTLMLQCISEVRASGCPGSGSPNGSLARAAIDDSVD